MAGLLQDSFAGLACCCAGLARPGRIGGSRGEPMPRERPRTAVSEEDVDRADVRQLERALAQAQAACRARDELLSIAAHALRTPLTAMLGWVTLLRAGEL